VRGRRRDWTRGLCLGLLLSVALLAPVPGAAGPGTAADEAVPDAETAAAALLGQPVAALLDVPGLPQRLRVLAGGRQRAMAAALRLPGPPLRRAEGERYIYGWGCAPAPSGCGEQGVFLAWEPAAERLFTVLVEDGRPVLTVPPRASRSWPAALARPVREFNVEAAGLIRFGQ